MLEVHRVYVDSRFKAPFSESNTNFKFELVDDLYLPPATKLFIDDITIPISFYTVEEDINDRLYVRLLSSVANGMNNIGDAIVIIPPGNYNIESLRDKLQEILNTAFPNRFSVESNIRENKFTIKIITAENFMVWTDEDLKRKITSTGGWNGLAYDAANLKSFNTNIKNTGASAISKNGTPFISGFVDFLNVHTLDLHSNLSSYNSLNHTGKCNIIKKICVTSSFGSIYKMIPR